MIKSKLLSSKTLTAAVTALALSTQAIGFASSASAYDRYGGGYGGGYGHERSYRGDHGRDFGRRDFDHRSPRYVETRKKDRTGRNIAIGIGAFMLGAIIASEAARR